MRNAKDEAGLEPLDLAIRDNLLARIAAAESEGRLGWGPSTDTRRSGPAPEWAREAAALEVTRATPSYTGRRWVVAGLAAIRRVHSLAVFLVRAHRRPAIVEEAGPGMCTCICSR